MLRVACAALRHTPRCSSRHRLPLPHTVALGVGLPRDRTATPRRTARAPWLASAMAADAAADAGKATPRVLVPVAEGSEEIETVVVVDVLRRAKLDVTLASVELSTTVRCSRGVVLTADARLDDLLEKAMAAPFDLIVLPGGMPGAQHLHDHEGLAELIRAQASASRPLAAICAAPAVVLKPHGALDGKEATCHPAFAEALEGHGSGEQRVVVDGNVTTSRGPGTAIEFALQLVKQLCGNDAAEAVRGPMLARV